MGIEILKGEEKHIRFIHEVSVESDNDKLKIKDDQPFIIKTYPISMWLRELVTSGIITKIRNY